MRGLYAIVDVASLERRGLDACAFTEAVASAAPAAIQLRDKRSRSADTLALLRAMAAITRPRQIPLFANDRADLALLASCTGVHVGQDDLPPSAVRTLCLSKEGSLTIGMSVHDDAELDRALKEQPSYIALGPVFATHSKDQPSPTLGVAGLERLAARARAAGAGPLVAIGGLDATNVTEVAAICDACAVIGALLPDADSGDPYGDVAARAAELQRACTSS
jgi:thiamine-phosphate pyrophosphorylase